MKILVVEDDSQLAELLEGVFREDGFTVTICGCLKDAEDKLAKDAFDVVVLDRMLPDGDGIDLCAKLSHRIPPVPVLLLTARGEVDDRVAGLRNGADDYIVKPFNVDELLARVNAVQRRVNQPWVARIGELEIDRRAQTVRAGTRRLDLTGREYALLTRLADSLDECVSRQQLLSDVWNMNFDPASGVIDFHVSKLRDKLGDLAWMVETVRNRGLRLRSKS